MSLELLCMAVIGLGFGFVIAFWGYKLLWLILPIVVFAGLTLAMGLFAEPFLSLATRAAEQLMNPPEYIQAVLGGSVS